jgi:AcrR family transcriptional regulator
MKPRYDAFVQEAKPPAREAKPTRRRAPAPAERRADAERSRRKLLDAAREEFSAKGYAGARVADIAARAGLNKQLISYYFGGKAGLYGAIQQAWLDRETEIAPPELPLAELITRYLHAGLADPRAMRLMLWRALAADDTEQPPSGPVQDPDEDLSRLRRRQSDGELSPDLDPAAVLLVMMGAVTAPLILPGEVTRLTGLDPRSPEFETYYAEQLRRVMLHLAGTPTP